MPILPPATKLPLAVRKNLRDEYEAKKEDAEKQVSELLGHPWTFDIDALSIWPYGAEGSYGRDRVGSCIYSYVEGVIYGLQNFVQEYEDDGKKELNAIAHKHSITLAYDDTKKYSYCGPVIKDGQLVILFSDKELGTNCSYCLDRTAFQAALNSAEPAPSADGSTAAMSYAARAGIKKDYEPQIEEMRKKIIEQIKMPDIKLEPNFEANFATMKKHEQTNKKEKLREDWETNFGRFSYLYFEGLEYYLKYLKFDEDEMLHEGFQEAVTSKEIHLKIVDKLETTQSTYHEILVKDGVVCMQTIPKYFDTNISDTAAKIMDQL